MQIIRNWLKKCAGSGGKVSNKLRRKRFELFLGFLNSTHRFGEYIKILDVGGRIDFWENMNFLTRTDIKITLLNLKKETSSYDNVEFISGDGRNMKDFCNKQFDIAFSNSVIEHVGSYKDQLNMAQEMERVGKTIFLQTPNYWFPFEPHFLAVGYHYCPVRVRAYLLRHFNLGWYSKISDYEKSIKIAKSIRLLRKSELKQMFPASDIFEEKFFGLTKSFIVRR